jgi:hypothetical protein
MFRLETKSQRLTLALRRSNLARGGTAAVDSESQNPRPTKAKRTKKNSLETEISKLLF